MIRDRWRFIITCNKIHLDKVKDGIKYAYAKGRINEQHYKFLIEKISDSTNKRLINDKLPSGLASKPTAQILRHTA